MDGLSSLFSSLSLLVYMASAAFAVEIFYRLYSAARSGRSDCRAEVEEARAAARAEAMRECTERMERLCGLDREAQAILDALTRGKVLLVCPDGSPAKVIGGEVVCKGREEQG